MRYFRLNLLIGLSAVFDFLLELLLLLHHGLNLLILPVLAVRSLLLSLLTTRIVGLLKLFLSVHQIDGGSFPFVEVFVHLSNTWLFVQNMPREDGDDGQILSFELN